jgi:hypothetical protein
MSVVTNAAMAQAKVQVINITDFGAKPNDGRSDQEGFNKAAAYINKVKKNVRLLIQPGTYVVGQSLNYRNKRPVPVIGTVNDVINLEGCSNISFKGMGAVTIIFSSNHPFGTLPNQRFGKDSAVHIGSLFRLTSCDNITIEDLVTDGNNEKFTLLKPWGLGDNPYEREHEGLFILNCQHITVKNVSFNRFGRDGCMILEDQDKQKVKDLSFFNCSFNNNGRNGFSWCGGKDVRIAACNFNNNGSGKIKTSPGAGLDIEPERGASCKSGTITASTFSGNHGYAVTSGYSNTSDISLDSCLIIGTSSSAIYLESPSFIIKNSTIAGNCLFFYDSHKASENLRVSNCIFTDSIAGKKIGTVNYTVGVTGRFVSFYDCKFYSYKVPSLYTELRVDAKAGNDGNTLFSGCSFYAFYRKATTWQKHGFLLGNCTFNNCNFLTTGYGDYRYVLTEAGRNIVQKGSKFSILK